MYKVILERVNLRVYSEQLSDKIAVDDISILLMVVSKLNSSTNLKVVSSDWFGVVVSVTFSSIFATMCFCRLHLCNICHICEFRQQGIVCCQIMSFQQTKGNDNFSKSQIWGKIYEKWPKFWVKIDKYAPFDPNFCRSNFKFFLCVEMFLKCLWSKFEEFWTIYVPEQILWISVAYVFVLWGLSLRVNGDLKISRKKSNFFKFSNFHLCAWACCEFPKPFRWKFWKDR